LREGLDDPNQIDLVQEISLNAKAVLPAVQHFLLQRESFIRVDLEEKLKMR